VSSRSRLPPRWFPDYIFDMNVTVLLFASYADRLGASSLAFDLPSGATVGDMLGRVQALPGAERLPRDPLIAVNERYARRDRVLVPGDEVAIIPPVAGG
jgi:molybdopterin converting factor subunit 1